jgi:CRP-like cAMP-binding protein/cytochrome P450
MCPGTWLLGNARSLLDDTAGTLTAGYERCGPVFRIRAGWRQYTIVAGPEVSQFMGEGLDKAHLSRERLFGTVAREFGRADLILKEIGPRHARLRPPLAVAYSRQVASPHVPALIDVVARRVGTWPPAAALGVVTRTKELAFAQYSTLLGTQALAFRDCLLMTTYLMNVAARLLPSIVLRAPWYRRAHRRTYGAITELVRRRRERGQAEGVPTLVDALASVRDPSGTLLTDDEVVSYAAYGIGASIGYVGRLTSFMLYEILRDAELHAQLVAEARTAFSDGLRDAADVRRMRLLRSVYDETLRLHSLAIGMPFDVASHFRFRGFDVPKGGYIVLSPVPSSYAPAHFPDPHRFDSARCRDPRNEHRKPGACQPFGAGDRTCAAMGLVELMSMTLVATVLHERHLTMQPPTYRLRRAVFPLPSPDRRFRMQVSLRAASPDRAHVERVVPEEEALASFPGHDQPAVREALASAEQRVFGAGQVIIREGDVADAFYLLEKGQVEVSRGTPATLLATLSEGECFGEAGLLQQAPRNATVTAGPNGAVTRVISGEAFLAMVAASDLVAAEIGQLLRKRAASARLLDVAPRLTNDVAQRLLPEFTRRTYAADAIVVSQGDVADEFFIVVSGDVVVSRRDAAGQDQVVASLAAGEYFGEMGLLHGAPRNATVVAGPGGVETLVTGRAGFDRLLAEGGGTRGELAAAMLARTERLAH